MIASPALTMERERRRPILSERATLDPLDTRAGETPPLQHGPLERQSFSLANAPTVCHTRDTQFAPIHHSGRRHSGGQLGADTLMLAATKNLAAQDRRPSTSRPIRFTPYKLPVIGRATGGHGYQLLKGALIRLRPTLIRITIPYGAQWRRHQFSWINEWPELATRSGRCHGIEFVVPAWFYQRVLDRLLVPLSRGGKHRSGTAHRQERDP
jgi:Replication initiator protein A